MREGLGTAAVDFGPDVCGDLSAAERREWLVTNSIGGHTSGTIAGGVINARVRKTAATSTARAMKERMA